MTNERLLNNLFDDFLKNLPEHELGRLLLELFDLPVTQSELQASRANIQSFLSIPRGEIDEFISFGASIGIAIELKDQWKTSPGQLRQYFTYAQSRFPKPFLFFISQSSDDGKLRWIEPLFQNKSWKHLTWQRFSRFLDESGYTTKHEQARRLGQHLKDCGPSVDSPRPERDYGLRLPLPPFLDLNLNQLHVSKLSKDGPLVRWKSAQGFWTDVVDSIWGQLGEIDFFSYRRDLYRYMFRWAFHERNVFFDMRKDNFWEHYFEYYEEHMKGKTVGMESVTMSSWYYKYLQVPKSHFVQFERFNLGVTSVIGKDCYFVAKSGDATKRLTRLNCWEVFPW